MGALSAPYGGYVAVVLEAWIPWPSFEWSFNDPRPDPNPWADFDTHHMAVDGIPVVGGGAY